MVEVRPVPRFVRVFEEYLIERRWWQSLPIPLIISLALHRRPYRIAGGSVLTYTLASVALGAGVLALPRGTSWWGIPQSWTTVLHMSSRMPTGLGSWTADGEPPGPVAPLRGLPTV
jgi:hypothetical protein